MAPWFLCETRNCYSVFASRQEPVFGDGHGLKRVCSLQNIAKPWWAGQQLGAGGFGKANLTFALLTLPSLWVSNTSGGFPIWCLRMEEVRFFLCRNYVITKILSIDLHENISLCLSFGAALMQFSFQSSFPHQDCKLKYDSRCFHHTLVGLQHICGFSSRSPWSCSRTAHRSHGACSHREGSARSQGRRLLPSQLEPHHQHLLTCNDHRLGSHFLLPKFSQTTQRSMEWLSREWMVLGVSIACFL